MVNIGIDFDGVIIDSSKLKIKIAKELFGFELTPETANKENILSRGVDLKTYSDTFKKIILQERSDEVDSVPYAKEIIDKLFNNNKIYIITSRHNEEVPYVHQMLKNRSIKYNYLINTYDQSKEEACLKNRIRIYLDDGVKKLEQIRNGYTKLFLLTKSDNENINIVDDRIQRVSDWKDFYNKIKYLL
jgi:uncharacterized HAD superfamily protein